LRRPTGSANHASMKRPRTSPQSANDNDPDAKLPVRFVWDVYRAAARARYVGQVVAADADEAVNAAAVEFKTDIRKLIAVRQRETGIGQAATWPSTLLRRPLTGFARRARSGVQRRLCLLGRDILRDCLEPDDLARHLLLAGGEMVDAVGYLLLSGGDVAGDPIDAARYLVEPVGSGFRDRSLRC
jgi:hypothetical protein